MRHVPLDHYLTFPYRIIQDRHMVQLTGYRTVRRTWRERLFSLPWQPWRATKQMPIYEPNEDVYIIDERTVVCHPTVAERIKDALMDARVDQVGRSW